MQAKRPKVHHFSSLEEFLDAELKFIQITRPQFTLAAWAKLLGVQSPSSLIKVIQGQRNIGPSLLKKFETYFSFSQKELDYFRLLIVIKRAQLSEHSLKIILEALKSDIEGLRAVVKLNEIQ